MTFRTYIYQSWICAVSLFPSTLFPVHVWSQLWRSNVAFVSFGSISTRCPRGSWDACHVCPHPSLSAIITGWTRLNRLPNREKSQWNTAIALHNFTCHVAFQFRRRSSSLIFQVLIVFFLNEIVNCDFVRRSCFIICKNVNFDCLKRENVLSQVVKVMIPSYFLSEFGSLLNEPADWLS